jgi:uncharacterized membrane protein
MRYRVSGANQFTGEEISTTIEADDEQATEAIARAKGILVSEIVAEPIPQVPESDLAAVAAAARESGAKTLIPTYESIKRPPERYRDITRGAAVLKILAILAYVAAGLCVLIAIISALANLSQSSSFLPAAAEWLAVGMWLFIGLFWFAVAALLAMVGAVGLAVRDIANNSFEP